MEKVTDENKTNNTKKESTFSPNINKNSNKEYSSPLVSSENLSKEENLFSNKDSLIKEKKISPIRIHNRVIKFKKIESDSEPEFGRKTQYDSTSIITSSSEESDNSRLLHSMKKYDIDYHQYNRSKSTTGLYKHRTAGLFPVVREEKFEDEGENVNDLLRSERFKKINHMILEEGYDNIEELLIDYRPKKLTKSTKNLSAMDSINEEKEDAIDFTTLAKSNFKKLKYISDFEEDSRIGNNHTSVYYSNKYNTDEVIEEDNKENDDDGEKKKKKSYTENMKRVTEFVDKSDMIEENTAPKNYITEEIKEDPESEEYNDDIINNDKCKFSLIYLNL